MTAGKKKTIIMWALVLLNVAGFIDAVYLAMKTLIGSPIVCYSFSGCDSVAQSKYSTILGVPLSVLGAVFYAINDYSMATYSIGERDLRDDKRNVGRAVFRISRTLQIVMTQGVLLLYFRLARGRLRHQTATWLSLLHHDIIVTCKTRYDIVSRYNETINHPVGSIFCW